jgi:hypothetical protein
MVDMPRNIVRSSSGQWLMVSILTSSRPCEVGLYTELTFTPFTSVSIFIFFMLVYLDLLSSSTAGKSEFETELGSHLAKTREPLP